MPKCRKWDAQQIPLQTEPRNHDVNYHPNSSFSRYHSTRLLPQPKNHPSSFPSRTMDRAIRGPHSVVVLQPLPSPPHPFSIQNTVPLSRRGKYVGRLARLNLGRFGVSEESVAARLVVHGLFKLEKKLWPGDLRGRHAA
jgi:hypothetical protein